MNVAMFTNTFWPLVGGVERAVAILADQLRNAAHPVLVVTPSCDGAEESTEHTFRTPAIKNVAGRFSLHVPLPSGLGATLDAFKPDIIHSHQPFLLGDTALREAWVRHVPLVFTNHTLYERYKDLLPLGDDMAERVTRALPVEYANLCDLAIAPTPSIADLMRERGVVRPIEVVPTGIDVAAFSHGDGPAFRVRRNLAPDTFVLGHVGRLVSAKNLDFLAQSVARALHAWPQAHFLLVGDGEKESAIRATLEQAGVLDRATFTGALEPDAVAEACAAMDLFLFTSLTDTQGLVLIESMAAGTPIVALDAPGARDTIRHERDGLLLPAHASPQDVAAQVQALARDPGRLAAMRENARERAAEFDQKACSRRMLLAYDRVLGSWSAEDREVTIWEHFLDRLAAEAALFEEKAHLALRALTPS